MADFQTVSGREKTANLANRRLNKYAFHTTRSRSKIWEVQI